MSADFLPTSVNGTPTFNDLHNNLTNARIDYIERGGSDRLVTVRDTTEPYVDALDDILSQLPLVPAYERQSFESRARISALGIDIVPTVGSTALKTIAVSLGAGVVAGLFSGATGQEDIADVMGSAGLGYGLATYFSDANIRQRRPIQSVYAQMLTVVNATPEKPTAQLLQEENEVVIGELRRARRAEKREFAILSVSIAAGSFVGRHLLR